MRKNYNIYKGVITVIDHENVEIDEVYLITGSKHTIEGSKELVETSLIKIKEESPKEKL